MTFNIYGAAENSELIRYVLRATYLDSQRQFHTGRANRVLVFP